MCDSYKKFLVVQNLQEFVADDSLLFVRMSLILGVTFSSSLFEQVDDLGMPMLSCKRQGRLASAAFRMNVHARS